MSQLNASNPKLSPDDRYELAAGAQNRERTNSPKHLIVFGLVIVVLSLIILAIAWRSKASAMDDLGKRSRELAQIHQLIDNIQTLERSQEADPLGDENQAISDILSQFKRYAKQSKIEHDIGIPTGSRQPMLNSTKVTYPYSVRDPSLAYLLDWINLSVEQIPGLGVQEMTLKPEAKNWLLKVTYVRHERKE